MQDIWEEIQVEGEMKRAGMTFASHPSDFVVMQNPVPVMDLEQPTLATASHIGLPGTMALQRFCQDWEHSSPQAKGGTC